MIQPISLLPISEKIYGRLLYNEIYNFFITNHLISTNSHALNLDTQLASISSYQLPMKYMCRLMNDIKFEVYFLAYQKYSTRFGIKVSSLS